MSSSMVLELQRDVLDKQTRVSDLLRKTLVVAESLEIHEFARWAQLELSGYREESTWNEIPPYRMLHGQPEMQDPLGQWKPILFPDNQTAELFNKKPTGQSAAELEDLLENRRDTGGLRMPYESDVQTMLWKALGAKGQAALSLEYSENRRVLDEIRNTILNWTLRLVKENILGEGMRFTETERSAANEVPHSVINFYGDATGAMVQQSTSESTQASLAFDTSELLKIIEELRQHINSAGLSEEDQDEASVDLDTAEIQAKSENPKRGIIVSALSSVSRLVHRGVSNFPYTLRGRPV